MRKTNVYVNGVLTLVPDEKLTFKDDGNVFKYYNADMTVDTNTYTKLINDRWEESLIKKDSSWLPIEKDQDGVIIAPEGLVAQIESDKNVEFNNEIYTQIETLEAKLVRPMRELLATGTSVEDKEFAQNKIDTIEADIQALRTQLK